MFRFAHISDSHVRPVDAAHSRVLVEHLRAIEAEDVALVIHTGDLMDEPSPWAARAFRVLVSTLDVPLYVVPGNHDVYNPPMGETQAPWWAQLTVNSALERQYREWFGSSWYTFSREGVRFLGVNSLVINSGLPEEADQWKWLEQALADAAAAGEASVIFTHLPLFIGHPEEALDPADFRNRYLVVAPPGRDRLLALIRRYRVTAVLSGHIHGAHEVAHTWPEGFTTQFIATGSSGCPSSMATEQFDLSFGPEEGLGFHTHVMEGQGIRSQYHRYAPIVADGWEPGRIWQLQLSAGQEPPRDGELAWNEPDYERAGPPWHAAAGARSNSDQGPVPQARYVIQRFLADAPAAAPTLELTTQDGAEVYVNGALAYELTGLAELPAPWESASGAYAVERPRLSLPLARRRVRRGTNVLAIYLDGTGATKTVISLRGQLEGVEED